MGAIAATSRRLARLARGRAVVARGRRRRYDHARVGVGSTGSVLFAFGAAADAPRGSLFSDPLHVGPFALMATGGRLGERTHYAFDLGAISGLYAGEGRAGNAESRGLQRLSLESSARLGPALARVGAFEQGELLSEPARPVQRRTGAGLQLSLPAPRFESRATGRAEIRDARRRTGTVRANRLSRRLAYHAGGFTRLGAVRLRIAELAGLPQAAAPLTLAALSVMREGGVRSPRGARARDARPARGSGSGLGRNDAVG